MNLRLNTLLLAAVAFVCAAVAQGQPLPIPPGGLGVYHWLGRAPAIAGNADALTSALGDIERFGFGTVRIFVGGRYDYQHPRLAQQRFADVPKPVTLAKILALPRYRKLFERPQFQTIWLTAYPVFDYGQGPDEIDLRRPVPESEWEQEYSQMREMVEWLYRNFGDRENVVLITNHEADEKLREVLNATKRSELAASNVARDLRTRFRAVAEARRKYASASLKVLFGAEISLWKQKLSRGASGKYLNGSRGLNALAAVLPRLRFDFVSFSAWETLGSSNVGASLAEALEDVRRRTRPQVTAAGRAFFGSRHVVVGEFGYAREWKLPAAIMADRLGAFTQSLEKKRVRYAVYWQLYDNVEGETKGFGLLDPNGKVTCAGVFLLSQLQERAALSARESSCPDRDALKRMR